jgi:hypothetical protein
MLKSQARGETYYYGVMRSLDGLAGKNTPGASGPTPGGTAGGNYSYFFLVLALALGFAAEAFFFGAAFFFVAANSLTPFQIIQ